MKARSTIQTAFTIVLALLAIHISDVYAIDFTDHTGYTPNWAQSMGSYQALDRCNGIVGENSADGNWCMEWVASVIDQGDSTSRSVHPTTNMAERTCTIDIVCVFPGEFLKYTGSYYDLFDHQNHPSFTTANFGQTVENNKILVQIDMTGSKPETDILNMQTDTLSNDQYNITNQGFGYIESIPVRASLYKDHEMCGFGDCKITFEKMDVKGTTRTILVSHLDNGDGTFLEYRYDNDTGVWLAGIQTVKDNGQIFTNQLHIVDSNIYDHPTIVVSSNVQQEPEIVGMPDQARTITKLWVESSISNSEFLQKIQQLLDSGQMVIPYPSSQEWDDIKTLEGSDWIHAAKVVLGPWAEGVSGKSSVALVTFQDLIATKYLTEKSWENNLSTNQNSTIQNIQQTNLNTTINNQTNQVRNTSSSITPTISNNNNVKMDPASIAAGLFIILGLPAIIIFVIVWKLRKYLAKRRNNKLQKGT